MHQLFLQALREAETLPREGFDSRRMPLVAGLLDHVWRRVPEYRERMEPLLNPEGFDLAQWQQLPLLRAGEVEALGERLWARRLPKEARDVDNVPPASNLGSGRRSRLSRVADECERERAYERFGLDLSSTLAVLHPDIDEPEAGEGWSVTFASSPWIAGDRAVPATEHLAWLVETGSSALRTDVALGAMLAEAASTSPAPDRLRTVVVDDCILDSGVARAIAEGLAVDVRQLFTVAGVGVVASGRMDDGYTVAAGSMVVEVVDPAGRPSAVGELVVTPLYEYSRPLLRLATGVAATALGEPSTILGVRRLARVGDGMLT
jgi:hypothetical protein